MLMSIDLLSIPDALRQIARLDSEDDTDRKEIERLRGQMNARSRQREALEKIALPALRSVAPGTLIEIDDTLLQVRNSMGGPVLRAVDVVRAEDLASPKREPAGTDGPAIDYDGTRAVEPISRSWSLPEPRTAGQEKPNGD